MRLQAGKHQVTAKSAYVTESKNGTMGIVIKFENDDGEIECTRWLTEKTRERVLDDLETLGFERYLLNDPQNLLKLSEIIAGAECGIVVEDEEYQGNVTPKVKWINPSGPLKATGPDTIERLYGLLTGKEVAPRLVSQPKPVAPPVYAPIDDESVPF